MFTSNMGWMEADLMAHLIAEEMLLGDMMTLLKLCKGPYSPMEEKVVPESLRLVKRSKS